MLTRANCRRRVYNDDNTGVACFPPCVFVVPPLTPETPTITTTDIEVWNAIWVDDDGVII